MGLILKNLLKEERRRYAGDLEIYIPKHGGEEP